MFWMKLPRWEKEEGGVALAVPFGFGNSRAPSRRVQVPIQSGLWTSASEIITMVWAKYSVFKYLDPLGKGSCGALKEHHLNMSSELRLLGTLLELEWTRTDDSQKVTWMIS